jgi:hypothetical protein
VTREREPSFAALGLAGYGVNLTRVKQADPVIALSYDGFRWLIVAGQDRPQIDWLPTAFNVFGHRMTSDSSLGVLTPLSQPDLMVARLWRRPASL